MKSLASRSVSGDFRIDAGASRASVHIVLDNEHPRALGDHKAVAVGGKRARGALRRLVPRLRQRPQKGVAFDDASGDWRVNSTHQKHRLHSRLNMLVGITKGIGGRSTTGGDHVAVPAKTEAHADLARNRAHSSAWNTEQADLLDVAGMPKPVLFFRELLRAATRPEDYADLAFFLHAHCGWIESGVLDSFARCGNGQGHHPGNMLALAGIDPGEFVELGNLARDVYRKVGRIKARNAFDAGFSRENGTAKGLLADAVGADHAHSSDNHARKRHQFRTPTHSIETRPSRLSSQSADQNLRSNA